MNIRKLVSKTKPINYDLYGSYTNAKLVTYATWFLTENNIESRYENIVVITHKLFPEKFSMEEFPEHPHGYRIYNSVRRDAYKGKLLLGNMETSWNLTSKGIITIDTMNSTFNIKTKANKSKQKPITKISILPKIKKLKNFEKSKYVTLIKNNEEPSLEDLLIALGSNFRTPKTKIQEHLNELLTYTNDINQDANYKQQASNLQRLLKDTIKKWNEEWHE